MTDKLPNINKAFDKAEMAMKVINNSQKSLWGLSHKIRQLDDKLGEAVWTRSLQIEHALKILNGEIFSGEGYFEEVNPKEDLECEREGGEP